ncbi:tyrosine-type recombinase/integrase [Salipiger sp.]|uniref:tyrosine-type recombinase/integrase n=1 Tax=Salipiger sp. TaxID=2078585 RepID=UPI003A96C52C
MSRREKWHPRWDTNAGDWTVDFRAGGRRIRKKLGIADRGMRHEAVEVARNLYREVWAVEDARSTQKADPVTFSEAAELYVSAGGERRFLPRITEHFGARVLVDDIDALGIERAAAAIYPHAKPETVRRQLKVPIRAVQNFARGNRREKIPDTRRVRWLTPEEAERLLAAASMPEKAKLRDPNLETLRKVAFMLGTGAGPAETMMIDATGWNPETREWWLPGTKSVFRARFVYLPERSLSLIGDIRASGPAFVAPNGQPYVITDNRGGQMAEAFKKVRIAAGLDAEVVPYTLRHTWATWFYAQTKDWGSLLDQGGWNRADTANRYRKIAPSDLGNRLLAHGWDFRRHAGPPVKFGALVSV